MEQDGTDRLLRLAGVEYEREMADGLKQAGERADAKRRERAEAIRDPAPGVGERYERRRDG